MGAKPSKSTNGGASESYLTSEAVKAMAKLDPVRRLDPNEYVLFAPTPLFSTMLPQGGAMKMFEGRMTTEQYIDAVNAINLASIKSQVGLPAQFASEEEQARYDAKFDAAQKAAEQVTADLNKQGVHVTFSLAKEAVSGSSGEDFSAAANRVRTVLNIVFHDAPVPSSGRLGRSAGAPVAVIA